MFSSQVSLQTADKVSLQPWWEGFYALPEEQRPFNASLYTYNQEEEEFLGKAMEIYKQQK